MKTCLIEIALGLALIVAGLAARWLYREWRAWIRWESHW